jgi:ABC-2 type transport system permease protein
MTTAVSTMTASPASMAPTKAYALRTTRDDIKAVPQVVKSEWVKLRTVRSNTAIFWLTAALGAVTSFAVAKLVTDEVQTVAEVFVFSTVLTGVLASISGILSFTSEAQHGTLAGTLTAQPARWVVAAAKTVMAAARGFALGAAGMIAGALGAVAGGLDTGDTSGVAATVAWALLFTTLAAVLGLGVGMIVRNSSAALSGLLVWGLVLENLLTVFLSENISRFLPFVAGNNLLGIQGEGAFAESAQSMLSRTEDALLFGGYTAVALLAGTVLLYRRDTN